VAGTKEIESLENECSKITAEFVGLCLSLPSDSEVRAHLLGESFDDPQEEESSTETSNAEAPSVEGSSATESLAK
jgi:hypothetical protein